MSDGRSAPNGRPRPPGPAENRPSTARQDNQPAGNAPPQRPNPFRRPNFWVMLLILFGINWLIVNFVFPDTPSVVTVPYTFFKQQVVAGNVIEITSRGEDIQGTFKSPVSAPPDPVAALTPTSAGVQPTAAAGPPPTFTSFATIRPAFDDVELLPLLQQKNVVLTARPLETSRSPFWNFLLAFGPTLLLLGGFLWLQSRLSRGGAGGAFGLGASRAKRYDATTTIQQVNFDDVAGIDEVENELVEVVDFLKNPEKYRKLGARIPRGVLLIGAPGTGKTLLARAVAGEANVPFFSMSGSEFIEMVVGVGAARVRDLFKQAREAAPSIIFIDELDAIGRQRGGNSSFGGNDEREQTLNQILVEMDGFDPGVTVIVLGATNRADVLDPALLRPGRFDRRVTVQPPDKEGRAEILKIHTRDVPLAPDVNLAEVANVMPGATGAELRNLVNEASLLAARREHSTVNARDFTDAMEKIVLGAERRIMMRPEERERTAYHESGHALCGLLQPDSDPVKRVTVVPRAQSLGVTISTPADDRYNYTEGYLRARIVTALGGRAAEHVVYGNVTTGAENDLKQVTELARAIVTRFGMSDEVGQVQLISSSEGNFLDGGMTSKPYSEATAQAVDHAVRKIADDSYAHAIQILSDNRQRLEALTHLLLQEETLDEAEILQVTGLAPDMANKDGVIVTQ